MQQVSATLEGAISTSTECVLAVRAFGTMAPCCRRPHLLHRSQGRRVLILEPDDAGDDSSSLDGDDHRCLVSQQRARLLARSHVFALCRTRLQCQAQARARRWQWAQSREDEGRACAEGKGEERGIADAPDGDCVCRARLQGASRRFSCSSSCIRRCTHNTDYGHLHPLPALSLPSTSDITPLYACSLPQNLLKLVLVPPEAAVAPPPPCPRPPPTRTHSRTSAPKRDLLAPRGELQPASPRPAKCDARPCRVHARSSPPLLQCQTFSINPENAVHDSSRSVRVLHLRSRVLTRSHRRGDACSTHAPHPHASSRTAATGAQDVVCNPPCQLRTKRKSIHSRMLT